MESRVIFQDGMDIDPADFENLQDFAQRSIDHVVADGITSDRKYAGFAVTQSGGATISVAAGRLYSSGRAFLSESAVPFDFTTQLPVATKKIVSIVIYGQEIDTNSVPREFLINEDTGASEPRVIATEHARIVNVNAVPGQENADPLPPTLDSGVIEVARVLLAPTGVSTITMIAGNALDSVASVSGRVAGLEDFQESAGPQIAALGSDISSLKNASKSNTDQDAFARILSRMAVVETNNGIPTTAIDSFTGFMLDGTNIDAGNSIFKPQEGGRFPDEVNTSSALALLNPLDTNASVKGDFLFPSYTRSPRLVVGKASGQVQISSYSYQTTSFVQRAPSRTRTRVGYNYSIGVSPIYLNYTGYDYWYNTFAFNGETWAGGYKTSLSGVKYFRDQYYWYDAAEDHYWDKVKTATNVTGAQVAETFLNANDMWLDAVGLTFTKLAASGGITVAICRVNRGTPDLNNVISLSNVDRSALSVNSETVVPIQPVFLEGGQRYALVIITAADHWLASTQSANFPSGTFFYFLNGAFQQGSGALCFTLHAAKFNASRVVIDMQPLSLAGGLADIDIISQSIVPGSTDLTYEVQISGNWVPLNDANTGQLGAGGVMPALLPMRAVFTGTPDVMPNVALNGSQVTVSRPKTSFKMVGAIRTLPSSSTNIHVIAHIEGWSSTHHTLAAKLLTGAGYATNNTPSSFTTVTNADGSVTIHWVFSLGAAVTTYKVELDGTTDNALSNFFLSWRKDYAL